MWKCGKEPIEAVLINPWPQAVCGEGRNPCWNLYSTLWRVKMKWFTAFDYDNVHHCITKIKELFTLKVIPMVHYRLSTCTYRGAPKPGLKGINMYICAPFEPGGYSSLITHAGKWCRLSERLGSKSKHFRLGKHISLELLENLGFFYAGRNISWTCTVCIYV